MIAVRVRVVHCNNKIQYFYNIKENKIISTEYKRKGFFSFYTGYIPSTMRLTTIKTTTNA